VINLRRVTSSNDYFPFIDGLRFVSIIAVVLVHFVDFYAAHTYPIDKTPAYQSWQLNYVFGSSENSILLFFAISGFILGMPFAKKYFANESYPKLSNFYIRRLTRLEPPYLLVLTGLFLLNVFIIHRDTFMNTLPHYLASFFYLHNIVYQAHPTLNFVFWSLEIEVQFYLLAPLFAKIFKLAMMPRRALLVFGILFFGIMNQYFHPPFLSLFSFFHFFLAGFLALDLFLNNSIKKHYAFDLMCLVLVVFIYTGLVEYSVLICFMIGALLYFSSLSVFWEKFLALKWVSITGGMCYSIYMLHQPAMAVFFNRFFGNDIIGNSVWLDFSARMVITVTLVLSLSAVFFVLVERPCMKREWYLKFFNRK